MEGEKLKIFGIAYIHYEKKIKLPNFQPRIPELRATYRRYWYNNFLNIFNKYTIFMFICKYLRSLKRRINVGFLICFSILLIIIASLTPVYIEKKSKFEHFFLLKKT